jgi:signal transduction histidine kinase
MSDIGLHLDILLIYFVYGLGFFAMGLAMSLEISRSPTLASANLLVPLAGFGLLHGIHEWLEIFLLQLVWLGFEFPVWLSIFRLTLLAVSFLLLFYFGLKTRQSIKPNNLRARISGYSVLGIYIVFIAFSAFSAMKSGSIPSLRMTDVLIRYMLAVPGAAFACLGLHTQSKGFRSQDRLDLSKNINMAAVGFGIYGLTQIFVPFLDMFPARWINSDAFATTAGFPIQVIRAVMAMVVMTGMLRAVTLVEKERQTQLLQAQQSRLIALEQIQVELTEREILRRELLRHTVRAQEDERSRIARELHDETSQVLSAFSLDLGTLRQLSSRRKDITLLVDRLQILGKQMSQGIFRLVRDLRPAQLDDLGLASALHYLTERENCPPGLQISLEVKGDERRLDPIVETVLFRVAQEALTNIRRHSQVIDAQMRLSYEEGQVTLWIEDHGVGFNPADRFSPPRGWGLAGMQERVDSVDGSLNILSSPGKGTIIEVIIPSEPEFTES